MKRFFFLVAALVVVGRGVAFGVGQMPREAQAVLANAQGEEIGSAQLEETSAGVKIKLTISKLPPGVHAFHIHGVGKCETPDFKSAGPHFNPYGKKHGMKNPDGAHAGDLPNLVVSPDGTASVEVVVQGVTLEAGAQSLFQPEGTSLVIHADLDDEATDPAGNAGARIACGVITDSSEKTP